jgi:hypothetical protein
MAMIQIISVEEANLRSATNMKFSLRPPAKIVVAVLFFSVLTAASRGIAEGEDWLKWDNNARQQYVWCYVLAFQHGFQFACKVTATSKKTSSVSTLTDLSEEGCMARMPKFSKPIEYYSQKITDFYTSYPADRYVMIRELLDNMLDSRDLTIEQIHEKLKNHVRSRYPQ